MSGPIVIRPGGGEIVGDTADRRVEILSEVEPLHATSSRFGPRREGADLHVHESHVDLFYVLEGELTVRLGIEDEAVRAPQGTLALVPQMVVHGFRNGGDTRLRYLNLHAPGRDFADYLRAMRDGRDFPFDQHPPPPDGGRSPSEAVLAGMLGVFERDGLQGKLLADVEDIGIAEVRVEGAGEPRHVHHEHVESLYVLEGELVIAGRSAHPGSWVQIPPGMAHALTGAARVLDVHTPSCGFGGFLRRSDAAFDQTPV